MADGILPAEAKHTAELILFLDKLFDSLNGNTKSAPYGKPLKGGVTKDSEHFEFYTSAAKKLGQMRFFCKTKKRFVSVPSLNNFKTTIDNFKYLANKLLDTTAMKYVLPRAFNQDPLENFFALLRSHGVRSIAPDANHFITSYKALIINNFMAKHSPGANCEEDMTVGLLDNFGALLTGQEIMGVAPLIEDQLPNIEVTPLKSCERSSVAYIAGYAAKMISDATSNCEACSNYLFNEGGKPKYCELIYSRQYKNCHFVVPSASMYNCVGLCICYLYAILPTIGYKSNIMQNLKLVLSQNIKIKSVCGLHNMKQLLIDLVLAAIN